MAAATGDDEALASALARVVDTLVSAPNSIGSDKVATAALENAVSLSSALNRLGRLDEAPRKLAAVAEKIASDLPSFFSAVDGDDCDDDEARSKTVFSFYEATAASWLASKEPKRADSSLEALLDLRRRKTKKPRARAPPPLLSSAAVADALASRLSAAARKESAASSSSLDCSRLLEEAAEGCLEFAREARGEQEEEGKGRTTAGGALVAALDLALDAEAAGDSKSSKASALWRDAAAALSCYSSSSSSSLAAADAVAAASEARAFLQWRDAFDGTRSDSQSQQQAKLGPLDAPTRASLREGLRARWSRVTAAAASSSSSKSLTRSSSLCPSSSSSLALPPASVLVAAARLALSEADGDDARRASRAALKSAKARNLPSWSEVALSARVAAARAAAFSPSSTSSFSSPPSSLIDLEELAAIRDEAPKGALSRPFSAAREAAVLLLLPASDADAPSSCSSSSSSGLAELRSLAESVEKPEHWLLAAIGRLQLLSGSFDEAAGSFKEAAEEASSGRGASTDSEAAEYWLELGRALASAAAAAASAAASSSTSSSSLPASAAAAWLKAAAVSGPAQAQAFAELGAFYRDARGDAARALACFRRCLDIDPSVEKAGKGATSLLLPLSASSSFSSSTSEEEKEAESKKNVFKAKGIAKRATERAPDSPWAWRALADACLAQARGSESAPSSSSAAAAAAAAGAAEAAADAAAALVGFLRCSSLPSSDAPRVWADLGDSYLAAGRPGSSLKAFEKCVELLVDEGEHKGTFLPLPLLLRARALASAAAAALCCGDAVVAEAFALRAAHEASEIGGLPAAVSIAAVAQAAAADAALRRGWGALSAGSAGEASAAARRASGAAAFAARATPGSRSPAKLLGDAALLRCLSRQGTLLGDGGNDEEEEEKNSNEGFASAAAAAAAATRARRAYSSALFRGPSVSSAWGDVACALAASAGVARSSSRKEREGEKHFYEAAARAARAGLRLDGASPRLWALLGSLPSAPAPSREAALCRSLALDPRDGKTWAALARLYAEKQKEKKAGGGGGGSKDEPESDAERALAAARARAPAAAALWSAAGHVAAWGAAREASAAAREERGISAPSSSSLAAAEDAFEHALTLGGGAEPSLAVAEAEARKEIRCSSSSSPPAPGFSHEALAAATRAASAEPSCAAAAVAAGSALLASGDAAEAAGEFERALALLCSPGSAEEGEEEDRASAWESRVFASRGAASSLTPAAVAAVGLARAQAVLSRGGGGGGGEKPSSKAFPRLEALPAEERLRHARALLASSRGKDGAAQGKEQLRELLSDPLVGGDALASLCGAAAAAAAAKAAAETSPSLAAAVAAASAAALAAAGDAATSLPADLAPDSLDRAGLSVVAAALLGGASHRETLERANALLTQRNENAPPLSASAAALALAAAADAASSSPPPPPKKEKRGSNSRLLARAAFAEPSERVHVARASLAALASAAGSSSSCENSTTRLAALALKSSPLDASSAADAFLLLARVASSSSSPSPPSRSPRFAAHVAPWREDCRRAAEATRV